MTIAEKLYKLRSDNGLSQQAFADKVGVSQSAINYWENGDRQPRISQIKKIAKAFNVPLYILLDDNYELPDTTSRAWKERMRFLGDTEMERPPRFTVPMSNDIKKESNQLQSNSRVANKKYLDDLKFNNIIQKKKRGNQLTAEDDAYLEMGLRQALETAIKFYFMLNDNGKKKADVQITQFIEQLELLTKIPEYQKVSDNTTK